MAGLTPALVRVATPYALSNAENSLLFPVAEGRNVIGRSTVPCSDVGFINLDSPRSAISRLHAVIDIQPNHDAWIYDCKSTNGTVVAVRSGIGVLLEPERFYQLTPGTRVTIGDVELIFERHSGFKETPAAPLSQPPSAIRARSKSKRAADRASWLSAVNGSAAELHASPPPAAAGSAPVALAVSPAVAQAVADAGNSMLDWSAPKLSASDLKANSVVAAALQLMQQDPSNAASSRPYLDDTPTEVFAAAPSPMPKRLSGKKQLREAPVAAAVDPTPVPRPSTSAGDPKGKARRAEPVPPKDATPRRSQSGSVELPVDKRRLHVCLSGMDTAEKLAVTSAVGALDGRIVEDVAEASLLVVKHPPPRTPKFLIAVARGIPIVTPKYFDAKAPAQCSPFVPGMAHGGRTYKPQDIARAIAGNRTRGTPALEGRTFNVQQMPTKIRSTVADIIRGCGGTVSTKKKDGPDVTVLTEDAEAVYHSILSGMA